MNVDDMKRILERHKDELAALDAMTDEDIDFSDMPEITDEQWSRAVRGKFYNPVTDQVTLNIDLGVLAWYGRDGENPGPAINAALLEYVMRHRRAS